MTNKLKHDSDYWEQSRRPWSALLFILPFLCVYEIAAITRAGRNGADIWIRNALMESGLSWEWAFPLLTPLILLGWHLYRKDDWSWKLETLSGMFAESLLFAMVLVVVGQLSHRLFTVEISPLLSISASQRVIGFLGAGIYEELLFRLMLLPAIYWLLRLLLVKHKWAMVSSVILTSLLFALAHYLETSGSLFSTGAFYFALQRVITDSSLWDSFTFRCLAGLTFSGLFWLRGFGIAVGTHMLYDLVVGVVLGSL